MGPAAAAALTPAALTAAAFLLQRSLFGFRPRTTLLWAVELDSNHVVGFDAVQQVQEMVANVAGPDLV